MHVKKKKKKRMHNRHTQPHTEVTAERSQLERHKHFNLSTSMISGQIRTTHRQEGTGRCMLMRAHIHLLKWEAMLFEPEIQKWGKIFIFMLCKYFLIHMLEAWKYKFTVSSFSKRTRTFGVWKLHQHIYIISSLNTLSKNHSNWKKHWKIDK